MANFVRIRLDTTAPSGISLAINSGQPFSNAQLVDLTIGTSDGITAGYMMKIWGSVDNAHNANIQTTEGASQWITFNTAQQVKLSATDGSKTLNMKLRDDVLNISGQASSSIILDTTLAVITVTGPDRSVISENPTANIATLTFTVDTPFVEYKVKVVSAEGATHSSGALIPTTSGSVNTSGTGTYPASTPINVQITGTDLKAASATDEEKIIKVFVREASGNWSI